MGHLQRFQVTVGRSREVRGPDGMEMGIAALIVIIVVVMATSFGVRLIPMIQTLDALSLASGPARDAFIHHAVHGRWPAPGDPYVIAGHAEGGHVDQFTLGPEGVITAQMTFDDVAARGPPRSAAGAASVHGALSFRPALLGSRDAPSIIFLCGYARPVVAPVAAMGRNMTTLDKKILPPFCR